MNQTRRGNSLTQSGINGLNFKKKSEEGWIYRGNL